MTTEEKLDRFSQDARNLATEKYSKEISDYENSLNNLFESHRRSAMRQAVARLKLTREGNLRERNRRLSKARMEAKHEISTAEMELKDKLFDQVNEMIEVYRKKPEYLQDMLRMINDARQQTGENGLYIFVDKADEGIIQDIHAKTGLNVQVTTEPIIGGILAMPEGGKILVDLSYIKKLDSIYDSLKLGGEEE